MCERERERKKEIGDEEVCVRERQREREGERGQREVGVCGRERERGRRGVCV